MNNTPDVIQTKQNSQPQVLGTNSEKEEKSPFSKPEQQLQEGFNLMPSMTDEEKTVEKTKSTANIGSVLSLIALLFISLMIVGFNIISKQQLNYQSDQLRKLENSVNQNIEILIANESIVERVVLFEEVRRNAFSHKKILEFLSQMGVKIGGIEIKSVVIAENLAFSCSGEAVNLEQVSKFWYLLGVDENIESINLSSVSKIENGVRFGFEGKLNGKNFYNK
jgi:hypothetical protein